MLIPFPWQQNHWQLFLERLEHDRLPHALIFSGPIGIGKSHFAQAIANYLLCSFPRSGLPCGQCRSCQLMSANTHPDRFFLRPEEGAQLIKIDQIRALNKKVANTAQQGGRKVVLIELAESLNVNAANALLKSLEEPPKDTIFLLISHCLSTVMATIRSRCQIISMITPERSSTLAWLSDLGFKEDLDVLVDLAVGAPLLARDLCDGTHMEDLTLFYKDLVSLDESPVTDLRLVESWLKLELPQLLDWWFQLVHRLLVCQVNQQNKTQTVNEAAGQAATSNDVFTLTAFLIRLEAQGLHYKSQWLYRFGDKITLSKRQCLQSININKQLLLEELLLDWCAIIQSSKIY